MEKNSIKRLYIMPEVWETVTQSQVFNWITLINGNGISTDCLSITSEKIGNEKVKEIEKSISGEFIQIKSRLMLIGDIFLILFLLKYYFKNKNRYKKIVFQTRLSSIGLTFYLLNVLLPKAKFIFESRAAGNEERKLREKEKNMNLKLRIKGSYFELSEQLMVTESDRIFCVSNSLKEYYINKYNLIDSNFTVFPGAADSNLFYLDKRLRTEVRKEFKLKDDEILVVYSGRLEKKWEIPDKIITFFNDLYAINSKFKLLLITPDINLAKNLIHQYELKEISFIRKVDLNEVNKYLNGADIGLLLREDIPMNNVASPTKFAEYLMSGLPVIISHGIHDFSNVIRNSRYGVVVNNLDGISLKEYTKLSNSLEIENVKIATWGKNKLSKKTFIKKYIESLKSI